MLTAVRAPDAEELPYYLLPDAAPRAHRGLPVPEPHAAGCARASLLPLRLKGKPAAVVHRLPGRSELAPDAAHCAERRRDAGTHAPGRARLSRASSRTCAACAWWNETAPVVLPHLDAPQAALLRSELAYQNHVAESPALGACRAAPIHADLFRDNVMFDGEARRSTGVFDFYFAGTDTWLFDIAVCLNDWCVDLERAVSPRTGRGPGRGLRDRAPA